MNTTRLLLYLFSILLLAACEPYGDFHFRNKVLGKYPYELPGIYLVKSGDSTNQTVSIYQSESNDFIAIIDGDTVFKGEIVKKKDVYFINDFVLGDTSGFIRAFELIGDTSNNFIQALTSSTSDHPKPSAFNQYTIQKEVSGYEGFYFKNFQTETIKAFKKNLKNTPISICKKVGDFDVKKPIIKEAKSVIKRNVDKETIHTHRNPAKSIKIYPNPFFSTLNVEFPKEDQYAVTILDTKENQILKNYCHASSLEIPTSTFERGSYIIIVSSHQKVLTTQYIFKGN